MQKALRKKIYLSPALIKKSSNSYHKRHDLRLEMHQKHLVAGLFLDLLGELKCSRTPLAAIGERKGKVEAGEGKDEREEGT